MTGDASHSEQATAELPPIGGFILTGQLTTRRAAHAPVILRHDLTTEFFGIEEREAGWPDFHGFNVFPISTAALDLLRALLAEDDRHEIDTGHSAFGWIMRSKVPAAQLMGMLVSQPALFATSAERDAFISAANIMRPSVLPNLKSCPWCGATPAISTLDKDHTKAYGQCFFIQHPDNECAIGIRLDLYASTEEELVTCWNTRAGRS